MELRLIAGAQISFDLNQAPDQNSISCFSRQGLNFRFGSTCGRALGNRTTIDVAAEMARVTLDAVERTIFSDGFGSDAEQVRVAMANYFNTIGQISPLDVLGVPEFIPRLSRLRVRSTLKFFEAEIDRVISAAGHETTANTLSWAMFLLSQSQKWRARIEAEVDRELTGPHTTAIADRLVETRAVIDETIRLYQPIAAISRVAIEQDEPMATRS